MSGEATAAEYEALWGRYHGLRRAVVEALGIRFEQAEMFGVRIPEDTDIVGWVQTEHRRCQVRRG